MRQTVKGHSVVRAMTIDGDIENTMTVVADGEFLYIPQVIINASGDKSQKIPYYLEIPKRLLKEGVSNIDD